jgi:hypothetical protein
VSLKFVVELTSSHLDHIAHLGGALFGVFYYFEGKKLWNWFRIQCGAEPRGAPSIFF